MADWADDGVLEFGGSNGMSGRYEGKVEIRAWIERWFSRMSVLEFTVEDVALQNPWALGLSNTAYLRFSIDETTTDGITAHVEGVIVYQVVRGRIVHARTYLFDERPELAMWGSHAR